MLETFPRKIVQVVCAAALTLSGADAFAGNNCKVGIHEDEQSPINEILNEKRENGKRRPDKNNKTTVGTKGYRGLHCWWDGNEFDKTPKCMAENTRRQIKSIPKKV